MKTAAAASVAVALLAWLSPPAVASDDKAMLQKGVDYLISQQGEDGSYSIPRRGPDVGVTALCIRALADCKIASEARDQAIAKSIAWTLSQQQADGAFGPESGGFQTYRTAMAILALCNVDKVKHADAITKARKWLEGAQYDDKTSAHFGGFGYGKGGAPSADLSNTQMAIAALKEAGVGADDPVMKRAIEFVTRCQNDSETNKGAAELKIAPKNDGGFFYSLGREKGSDNPDGTTSYDSYASMTYAGLLSLSYAGLTRDDPRVKAALGWIKQHFTLEENYGMRARGTGGQAGLFYYYYTFARTLDVLGVEEIEAKDGKHKWSRELLDALAARQKADGSWVNPADRWMEGMPVLATAFAVSAGGVAYRHATGAPAGKTWY